MEKVWSKHFHWCFVAVGTGFTRTGFEKGVVVQFGSNENESIKIVGPEDRSRVDAILTMAFTMCPLLRWLYPEPERYFRHFGGFIEHYCGDPYTSRSGAYCDNGDKGALLWQTDKQHRDDARMMKFLLGSVPEYRRAETERLFDEFGKYHPQRPYWYFTVLGIDPMHQRAKLGERLFRYGLAISDEAKGLAFGEATSVHAAGLYERLGWKVMGEVQVGSSPPFFPIIRHPIESGTATGLEQHAWRARRPKG